MDYTALTEADRYRITRQKLQQYEQAHAVAVIDQAAAAAAGEAEQAKGFESQIAKWEQAAAAARKLLAELPEPPAPPEPGKGSPRRPR